MNPSRPAIHSAVPCRLAVLLLAALHLHAGADLAGDLKSGAIWEKDTQAFGRAYLEGERATWVDAEKTTLRIPGPGFKLAGLRCGETVVKFLDNKPVSLQIMLYNKGDDAPVSKKDFESAASSAQAALSTALATPGEPHRPKTRESIVKMKAWQWRQPACTVLLEYNADDRGREFEAEFIRLRILSDNAGSSERARKRELPANVKRTGQRVEIENIPMVDQGEKGYCVVATAARIFAYYGSENVDQHELASAANTRAGGGTSTREMREALEKISTRFQIKIRTIDSIESFTEAQNLIRAYNKEAKRQNTPQMPDLAKNRNAWNIFWNQADAGILKAARCGRASDVERWMRPIREWVDKGVPVLWTLHVGVVPEPQYISQSRGGHMRLIIGYDDEQKTILFSDSWGREHACKEMPMADAAAVTTSRMVLVPSR